MRKEICQTRKKKTKIKRKKNENKLKVAPTTMRNDRQRTKGKKNRKGRNTFVYIFNIKMLFIKQVQESQDEVHVVYPIDQVKLLMVHKDIQVEMYMINQNFLVVHNQF